MRQVDMTVAISTMERPSALARCIGALLDCDTLPAELVIIDQSTDDATERIIGQVASSSAVHIVYVRQPRLGLAASRNAAIAASTRPIVTFTDDDCVPDSDWLTAISSTFETDQNADVVTGRILPLGPEQPGLHAVSLRTSCIPIRFRGRCLPWAVGSGANIAVKREWLKHVGGFDERLGVGSAGLAAEDMDFLYRLVAAHATVHYEPRAVMFHERTDQDGWLARQASYSFGMGAFCGLWLRKHDPYACWILARWCADRAVSLAIGCVKLRWPRAAGELHMLRCAASGIMYGIAAAKSNDNPATGLPLTTECHW
jgi:GT2 family glycosyltransferase